LPKVTIYMSSYDHARYLPRSIDSVLNQTFSDFELFIMDDASSDNSWEIIQSYTDPRIRPLRNQVNRNDKAVMRQIIEERAAGEYFAVHHSDNIWQPGKLQAQVEFMETHPQVGAVFTNALVVDENDREITDANNWYTHIFDQPNRSREEWLNFFFHHGNALCHPSILIRRQCYADCGSYRDGLGQIPDLDMWVRLALKYSIHVLPEKLVHYRVPSDGNFISNFSTDASNRLHFEWLQVLQNYRQIPDWEELLKVFPAVLPYYREEGCEVEYVLARLALESDDPVKQLFGLNILFEALNDPAKAARIASLYGFSHKDFLGLTARFDLFGFELMQRYHALKSSRSYRTATLLRRVRHRLLPPGRR
jgi:glycosyltransferase involved in cell wall biosynthesis